MLPVKQASEFVHGVFADGGKPAGNSFPHLDRQLGGQQDGARVARHNHVAVHVKIPFPRPLVGRLFHDAVVNVAVQFIEGDASIAIQVGLASLEPGHEGASENRTDALSRHVLTLEGVLRGVGSGQNHSPVTLKLVTGSHVSAGFCDHPARKGPAVATIQQQHLAAGGTSAHHVVHKVGFNCRGLQKLVASVGGGKIELAIFILHSVAREVEKQQIITSAVCEEGLYLLPHFVGGFVQERLHPEAPDGRVLQNSGQRFGVLRGGLQLPQNGVLILVTRDD